MTVYLAENRRNYAGNPGARGGTAGWGQYSGTGGVAALSWGNDGSPAPGGGYARQKWTVASTAADGGMAFGLGSAGSPMFIAASGGQQMAAGMWVRPSKGQVMHVFPFFFKADGTQTGNAPTYGVSVPGGTWTRLTWSGTIPAGTVSVQIGAYSFPAAGSSPWAVGDTLDCTGVLVELGTSTPGTYFDGSTAATGVYSYAWAGEPNASQSIEYVVTGKITGRVGFTATSAIVWGLGDYDSPDLQFNGVDGNGVEWVLPTPEGWLTSSGDTPVVEYPGDGGAFSPGRRKPRTLTLKGAFRCADTSQMDDAESRLRSALEYLREDTYLWHGPLPTGAPARQMTVRWTGDIAVMETVGNPRVRTFTAVLTAADPLKYSAGAAGLLTYTTGLPQATGSFGVQFPLQFPLNFGGLSNTQGRMQVINPGTRPVYPTVTYVGPVDTPVLTHLDLTASEGVARSLLAYSKVVVDHRMRSIQADGASVFQQRLSGSAFFPLNPGTNALAFSANGYSPSALVTVQFRPAWS